MNVPEINPLSDSIAIVVDAMQRDEEDVIDV
jgi:hypothetical protein